MLRLTNYSVKKELKIEVHLLSTYTFYIEKTHNDSGSIELNKSISISETKKEIEELLDGPIRVCLEDQGFSGECFINASSLGITDEGLRVCR